MPTPEQLDTGVPRIVKIVDGAQSETAIDAESDVESDVWTRQCIEAFSKTATDKVFDRPAIDNAFLQSSRESGSANQLITGLSGERKNRWRNYQIELADESKDPEKNRSCLDRRNTEFPDIAKHLRNAAELLADGEKMVAPYEKNQLVKRIEKQDGPVAGTQARDYFRLQEFSSTQSAIHDIFAQPKSRELSGQEPSVFKGPVECQIAARLTSGEFASYQPGLPSIELIADRGDPSTFSGTAQTTLRSPLFEAANQLVPFRLRLDKGQNEPFKVDKYESLWRNVAHRDLSQIDKPGPREALQLRLERLTERMGIWLPPATLKADVDAFLGNPCSSIESKDRFIAQLDRLLPKDQEVHYYALAGPVEQFVVAAQLLNQAAHVKSIDQGDFPTCTLSSIEKRLLARRPDLLASMIADIAIAGTTTTETKMKVTVEKEWLSTTIKESTDYPPRDGVRSLASQYAALALGNVRFQLFNEEFGTNLRFAHINGNDVVMDYSKQPPTPIYGLNPITGEIDREQYVRLNRYGTLAVGYGLEPIKRTPLGELKCSFTAMLDTVEAVTGSLDPGILLMHYDLARIPAGSSLSGLVDRLFQAEKIADPRVTVYRNTSELKNRLAKAAAADNFPVFFALPGHVVTIPKFDNKTNKAEYDNHWGDKEDHVGANALTLQQLEQLGRRSHVKEASEMRREDKQAQESLSQLKELRAIYEIWCRDKGIIHDSRYPTKIELKQLVERLIASGVLRPRG